MEVERVSNTASFVTGGFSVFVVLGYTVDFHWGEYTYNLAGEGEIFLSELLHILGSAAGERTDEGEGASETYTGEADSDIDLLALAEDIGQVESVSFSNPSLVSIEQVQVIPAEYMEDEAEEEDDETLLASLRTDWLLTSLEPFDTQETLTINLTNGKEIKIPVTDERRSDGTAASGGRVVVDGVTYNLTTGGIQGGKTHSEAYGDSRAYYGKATAYAITAGCTLHDEIEYNGNLYKVWNIAQYLDSGKLTKIGAKLDPELVNRASGYSFRLPEMRTDISQEEKDQLAADGFTFGANNEETIDGSGNTVPASDNKLWKKATYNPETNSIDYEIKTFQAMKENIPLDFIFIYDDSITMYTGDRGAPVNNAGNNLNETVIREATGTRLLILSAAQALMEDRQGYDIRMAMAGASNGDSRRSSWYVPTQGGYAGVTEYLGKYATGTTDHVLGLNNARTLAMESRSTTAANGKKRQPIVIYLSDFIDGGNVAKITTAATQLHNVAPVYCLSTRNSRTYPRLEAIASEKDSLGVHSNYIHTMSEINDGVMALEDIIKDAIGYFMKNTVTVTDNLSEALSDYNAAAGTTTGGSNSGTAPAGTGKSTWSIGGTRPYPGAGTVYTENFSVKLDDNTVYTGSMPTNGRATVTVGGSVVNSLEPKENDPGTDPEKLHIAKGVTFLMGKTNEKGKLMRDETSGLPFEGYEVLNKVQFTLTEQGQSAPIGTYTVADGSFIIPFTVGEGSEKRVVLQMGKTYVLHEVADSVTGTDGYNDSVTNGKLVVPDRDWLIKVSDKGVITVTVDGTASQTPEATVAKAILADSTAVPPVEGKPARFVLWNNIIVPATLIPIQVKKV
jgi:hypothetical protein